ncbi:MAG: SUMF1/EgtB/PvdO family nonheme iron enzyme [Planctomycetes bacterium]|nr:SUMF1/EgtB/PvdO family nonheme iron enzyme [Planctomycetota bacterium]
MATLADLVKLRSLRWNRECADLDNRIGDWLAGRTGAMSRAPLSGAAGEIYHPELYVPMDGVSDRWFRDAGGRLRRVEEPGPDGRPSGQRDAAHDGKARAPLAWWVSRPELPRVALVGSPGEGKSVFLTRLAVALARVFRGADAGMADLAVNHLRDRAGQPCVPVVLEASDFARELAKAQGDFAIVAAVHRRQSMNIDSVPSQAHIRVGLADGRYLLLVDAWDEIPDAQTRNAVLLLLRRQKDHLPHLRLILATRSASYTGEAAFGPEIDTVTLQPFSEAQSRVLVRRWVLRKWAPSSGDELRRHEEALLRAIADLSNRMHVQGPGESVTGNPLMVTAICALHDNAVASGLALPEGRARLCDKLVNDLCESRMSARDGIGTLDKGDKRRILERFALAMQRRAKGQQELPLESAEAEILDEFGGDKLPPNDTRRGERAAWYLQWTADHTGLLTYRRSTEGGEDVRFRHRLFREYLAACRLGRETGSHGEDVRALVLRLWLDGRFTDPVWHDVMLLLPGGLADSRAVKLYAALLELARVAGSRKGRILGLAAAMVVETRRLYGEMAVALRAKEMVREYEQDGAMWPLRDRLLFLDMLGRLDPKGGDPRLAEDGYRWVSIPGGEVEIGGATWEQHVRVEPFELAWAPVTVQEYRAFVDAPDGADEKWWCGEDWETPVGERRRVGEVVPMVWRNQLVHPNRPVAYVTWYEAMAYCRWRTAHDRGGRTFRLPTRVEWQCAAEGPERYEFPWGNEAPVAGEAAQANWWEAGVMERSPVGAFPAGSRRGMVDLAGNVWEWCADRPEGRPSQNLLRGGSFDLEDRARLGCAVIGRAASDGRGPLVGLRIASVAGTR